MNRSAKEARESLSVWNQMDQNPYSSPNRTADTAKTYIPIIRTPLRLIAWLLVLFSAPIIWFAIELANQEYWNLWYRELYLTNIEHDGQQLSASNVIAILVTVASTMNLISFVFFFVTRKRKPNK